MDADIYDFSQHLPSVKWLEQLPNGLVTPTVDLRHANVRLEPNTKGLRIYISPKNENIGGDILVIDLNKNYQLEDYLIERIEPEPKF